MRKNKLLLLLVLLMTAATGAWAKTYTVTFGGFGNTAMNRSVTYNSMPQEITNIGGIDIDMYEVFGRNDMTGQVNGVSVISDGNGKVSAYGYDWETVAIVVNGSFSGTATIRIRANYYYNDDDDEKEISRDITVRCEESAAAFYTVTYDANGGTGAPSAQEYAINRVICGRHYKSDIDASLVEATAVMSRLLSNAAFLEQLEKARKEYARLRK